MPRFPIHTLPFHPLLAGAESDFFDAEYEPRQALEVVLGLAFSLMANYAGHLVSPPLDPPLRQHEWRLPTGIPANLEPQYAL